MDFIEFGLGDLRFDTNRTDGKAISALPPAVASFFEERGAKRIYIGYDARLTSPSLAQGFADSMRDHGIDVVAAAAPHSSCLFYWSCLSLGVPGVMVTASHNPGEWNGIKMVESDLTPIPPSGIAAYFGSPIPVSEKRGRLEIKDNLTSYVDSMMKISGIGGGEAATVLVDFLHGANAREIGTALSRLPSVESDLMHAVPDGSFPAGEPNPMIPSSMECFIRKLKEGGYDLGFAFDGDGDRTAAYLPDGSKIESYVILDLIGRYLSKKPKHLFDAKLPIPLINRSICLCRTGHANFDRMMRKDSSFTAGAEGSGHFYYRIQAEGRAAVAESSMLTMLLVLRARLEDKAGFLKRTEEASRFRTLDEISRKFGDTSGVMKEVRDHFGALGATFIDKDSEGKDLGSLVIGFKDFQIYQHASETEAGKVRWQITEYSKNAADAAFEYLNCLSRRGG